MSLDGKPVLTERFSKAKLALLQTTTWDPLQAPVGAHELTAQVYGGNGKTYRPSPSPSSSRSGAEQQFASASRATHSSSDRSPDSPPAGLQPTRRALSTRSGSNTVRTVAGASPSARTGSAPQARPRDGTRDRREGEIARRGAGPLEPHRALLDDDLHAIGVPRAERVHACVLCRELGSQNSALL